jgi:hypothetical protein
MSSVIVFPRGQLTPEDRDSLMQAGIVAVEVDDPKAVVQLVPGAPMVGADDLLMSALRAVVTSEYGNTFTRELERRLLDREQALREAKQ